MGLHLLDYQCPMSFASNIEDPIHVAATRTLPACSLTDAEDHTAADPKAMAHCFIDPASGKRTEKPKSGREFLPSRCFLFTAKTFLPNQNSGFHLDLSLRIRRSLIIVHGFPNPEASTRQYHLQVLTGNIGCFLCSVSSSDLPP